MKIIKEKTDIKTLRRGKQSLLNHTLIKQFYDLQNPGDMEKFAEIEMEKDRTILNFEYVIDREIRRVKAYLEKFNIPTDESIQYEYVINYKENSILINGKRYDSSFHPLKEGLILEGSGEGIGHANYHDILKYFFSHIPAILGIANFFSCIELVRLHRDKGELDQAVICAIYAINATKQIIIAEFEDDYLSESERSKDKDSPTTKTFIAKLYIELENSINPSTEKKYTKDEIASHITTELETHAKNKSSIRTYPFSTIRRMIQGKSLKELKEKYLS